MKNRYLKTFTLVTATLLSGFAAQAELDTTKNGVSKIHVQDDFMTTDPYESLDTSNKWINWFSEDTTVFKLERLGDGALNIHCDSTSPAFTRIMMTFGDDSTGTPLTIDLTNNAMISFDVENTHADSTVFFTVGLIDINDNTIEVAADTMDASMWNGKVHSTIDNLLPGTTENFQFDLTGGYALNAAVSDGWPCTNGAADCPLLKQGDLSQIRAVAFNINPGAGMVHTNKGAFTGVVKLSNLKIGGESLVPNDTMSVTEFETLNGNVEIFPNPMTVDATIRLSVQQPKHTTIRLINAIGQTVQTISNSYLTAGTHQLPISKGDLNEGIYFLQISNDTETVTKKILMK